MSRDMTVGQLRELLADLEDETPIRLAFQPSWPLQYHLDDDIRLVRGVAYIREGGQVYSNPYAPRSVFGEPEPEECANCGEADVVGTVRPAPSTDRELVCRRCLTCEVPPSVFETYQGPLPIATLEAERAASPELAQTLGQLAMEEVSETSS